MLKNKDSHNRGKENKKLYRKQRSLTRGKNE